LYIRQTDGTKKLVDIRTLPFVKFDDNEVQAQRRFGLNLGGMRGVATQDDLAHPHKGHFGGDVAGVGPDSRHPFVIRRFRAWRAKWPYHAGSPSVYIDGLDIYDSTYGIWRSRVDLHEYVNVSLRKITEKAVFLPFGGGPVPFDPGTEGIKMVDDFPPITVINGVQRIDANTIRVWGTASDNNDVARVTVNGKDASSMRDHFSEWEIMLEAPAENATELKLEAKSEDRAKNVELTPHVMSLPPGDSATRPLGVVDEFGLGLSSLEM
jgi:hypothetical protein